MWWLEFLGSFAGSSALVIAVCVRLSQRHDKPVVNAVQDLYEWKKQRRLEDAHDWAMEWHRLSPVSTEDYRIPLARLGAFMNSDELLEYEERFIQVKVEAEVRRLTEPVVAPTIKGNKIVKIDNSVTEIRNMNGDVIVRYES